MPLNEYQLDEFEKRYWRENDRYVKFAQKAGDLCRKLIKENAIRGSVHWRAKTKESAKRKLQQKYSNDINEVEEAFNRIKDLAAVRILTYVEEDRERVVDLIKETFSLPPGADELPIDIEDKVHDDNEYSFYRSTHCQVALPDEYLIGDNENLKEMSCEIQVCSMLAHVWNELEHDLIYKPQSGKPSSEEKELLRVLGNQTLAGDGIISRLLNATNFRQRTEHENFADQYDFVNRMRGKFYNISQFHRRSEQAFNVLQDLNITNPASVSKEILNKYKDPKKEAQNLISRIHNENIESWSPGNAELDEETADIILILIANIFHEQILEMYPGGYGKGRPPRVAYLARLIRNLQDSKE